LEQTARNFRAGPNHCSYHYTGAGLTRATITPNHVLAYERSNNHGAGEAGGGHLLYGDGRVAWIATTSAFERLAARLAAGHNPP